MSSTTGDRIENDDYPTPPWAVERLIEKVWLPRGRWLEPAAGAGQLIAAVNGLRLGIDWTAIELQKKHAPQLAELTSSYDVRDFFEVSKRWLDDPGDDRDLYPFDVAITNPPYSHALEFLKACRMLAPFVCMLLRVGWLEGGASDETAERAEWLDEDMPDVHILPNRPPFSKSKKTGKWGTDSATYAWCVWRPDASPVGSVSRLALTPKEVRADWLRLQRERDDAAA